VAGGQWQTALQTRTASDYGLASIVGRLHVQTWPVLVAVSMSW